MAAGYAWRLILISIAVYGVFAVLGRLQLVAIALFGGLVICAILRPVTLQLSRLMPRALAVAVSILGGIIVVGGLITFITASVAGQFSQLFSEFQTGLSTIEDWLRDGPLPISSADLNNLIEEGQNWLTENRDELLSQAVGAGGVAAEVLAGLALAIFSSVFFLHSGDKMWAWFLGQLPVSIQARCHEVAQAGWDTFAGYTRGIVIVAGSNAAVVGIVLLILQVPLALPLALLVFFATFIPLIGSPIALAVATLVALAGRGPAIAIAVLALIVLIGQFEGHVLQPLVMSRQVSLHPVIVAVAVAAGSLLAGVIGAIVAVPLVSVAWAVTSTLRRGTRVGANYTPD